MKKIPILPVLLLCVVISFAGCGGYTIDSRPNVSNPQGSNNTAADNSTSVSSQQQAAMEKLEQLLSDKITDEKGNYSVTGDQITLTNRKEDFTDTSNAAKSYTGKALNDGVYYYQLATAKDGKAGIKMESDASLLASSFVYEKIS